MSRDLGRDVPDLEKLYARKLWADFSYPKISKKCGKECPTPEWSQKRRILSRLWLSWFFFWFRNVSFLVRNGVIRRKPKGDGGKGTGKKMSRQFATNVTTIYDMSRQFATFYDNFRLFIPLT